MIIDFNKSKVSHIATAYPKNNLDLIDLKSIFGEKELTSIMKLTGIKKVRIAEEGTTSMDMCLSAAEKIFESYDKTKIEAIVFVSQTREYLLPQTSFIIQDRLGLSEDVIGFDLPLGCSGYIYGLLQAAMLVDTGAVKSVLVLAGDTNSRLVNEKDRATRMVFGDAGSASIVEAGKSKMSFNIKSDGAGANQLIVEAGAFRCPSTPATGKAILKEEGNYRSKDDIYMDGMGILNFARVRVKELLNAEMDRLSLTIQDLDLMVLHQANKFMVEYLGKRFKIDKHKLPVVVDGIGNTGPSSIPLVLSIKGNEFHEKDQLNNVMMCGFGVGLSWGVVTTNLSETKFHKPVEI